MRKNLKIAVVDDHPLFREGVRLSLMECGFTIVAEGECAADAVAIAQHHAVDILLLDVSLPGGGIEAITPIFDVSPDIKIVILTASEQEHDLHRALHLGIQGYVLKGIGANALADVLDQIIANQRYIAPTLSAKYFARQAEERIPKLTEREQQILDLLLQGFSNQKIAVQLVLQEKTVKHHMTRIFLKLKATNRTEAALLWRKFRPFYLADHRPDVEGEVATRPSRDDPARHCQSPPAAG
jgi:DNA-binding NarL/FixJ family response regulator